VGRDNPIMTTFNLRCSNECSSGPSTGAELLSISCLDIRGRPFPFPNPGLLSYWCPSARATFGPTPESPESPPHAPAEPRHFFALSPSVLFSFLVAGPLSLRPPSADLTFPVGDHPLFPLRSSCLFFAPPSEIYALFLNPPVLFHPPFSLGNLTCLSSHNPHGSRPISESLSFSALRIDKLFFPRRPLRPPTVFPSSGHHITPVLPPNESLPPAR